VSLARLRGDSSSPLKRSRLSHLKIGKQIELGRPWQSFIVAAFGIQNRMADYHFAQAEG
jgi:hypothetical protein